MKKDQEKFETSTEKHPRKFSIVHLLIGVVIAFTAGFLISDAAPKEASKTQIDAAYSSGLEEGRGETKKLLSSQLEEKDTSLESQAEKAKQQGYEEGQKKGYDKGYKEGYEKGSAETESVKAQAAKEPAKATATAAPTPVPTPTEPPVEAYSPPEETTQADMVWIPTHGGKKYHSSSSCSKMKDPDHVTREEAEMEGFTPCKRCYG